MELLKNCLKIPEYDLESVKIGKKNHILNIEALPAAGGLVLRDP